MPRELRATRDLTTNFDPKLARLNTQDLALPLGKNVTQPACYISLELVC